MWRRRAASAMVAAGCMAVGAAEPSAADWYLRAGICLGPRGEDRLYGSGLFERLAGGALWLRHGRRRRSLSFGRAFREDDSP